ncbi:hypothetical protein [Massilia genomosp. 1]|uniref:TIGR02270 family protein n=1 Tax=Massilia genomosp. 1 TaxID=2609280 RepID=A0ABX0N3S7_9BURK|nr:hypothetical protein [Massilia genomosp. 1]NHZ66680.1 hypothetical protein [Massilia genomosp. 1]
MNSQSERHEHEQNVIPLMVRRHAEEAATRWWRRSSAYIEDERSRFSDLIEFDDSIDAHLDGLSNAGNVARMVLEQAMLSDARDASAEIFVALVMAFETGDPEVIQNMLAHTKPLPGSATALQGLFAWSDDELVGQTLRAHLTNPDVRYQHAALAECHTQRVDGGDHLAYLISSENALVARAIRTAAQCGRVDLLSEIKMCLELAPETDGEVRYWAAWALLALGNNSVKAVNTLMALVNTSSANNSGALQILCLTLPRIELLEYLQRLSTTSIDRTLYIQALGWSGHAGYVPYLIDQMRITEFGSCAGEACRLITGFDLLQREAELDPTPYLPDISLSRLQSAYPYPNAAIVSKWWEEYGHSFDIEQQLLLGEPISLDWLDDIIMCGEQTHRDLAALLRWFAQPGQMLLPTHAHCYIQWLRLQQLKGN